MAAIRCHIALDAGQTAVVDLISGVAASRDECLALIRRCREPGDAVQAMAEAEARARRAQAELHCTEAEALTFTALAVSIFDADAALRAPVHTLALSHQGQSGLWRFAISGDLPIMLFGVDDPTQIDCARRLVQAHA